MALIIGSTTLPTPKSVTYSDNKLWSENTGRLDSGYFVGEMIGIKRKYEVVFPPLTESQFATVRTAVNADFASVTITDMSSVSDATLNAYFGDLTYDAYSWHNGIKLILNASVSIIER